MPGLSYPEEWLDLRENPMGLFDRFRRRPKSSSAVRVPKGHEISIAGPSVFPLLRRCKGGMLLAHMGIQGKDQREDVEILFSEVFEAVREPGGPVLLANEATDVSGLFAPNDPKICPTRPGVAWTASASSFSGFCENVSGVQRLLRLFYKMSTASGGTPQFLYLYDRNWPNADAVVELLAGVGVQVRSPDETGDFFIEVARPEGVVVSALLGTPILVSEPPPILASLNREKDDAIAKEDEEARYRVGEREKAFLSQRISEVSQARTQVASDGSVLRDGRLRRLLLAVQRSPKNHSVWTKLFEELLEEESPLVLLTDLNGKVAPMKWRGIPPVIPVFSDLVSAQQAATDTGWGPKGYGVAHMTVVHLCSWLLETKTEGFLNVFEDPTTPHYVRPGMGALRALAEGRVPTEAERCADD
jgi:hypothetical protein